jgi:hypothetical protein
MSNEKEDILAGLEEIEKGDFCLRRFWEMMATAILGVREGEAPKWCENLDSARTRLLTLIREGGGQLFHRHIYSHAEQKSDIDLFLYLVCCLIPSEAIMHNRRLIAAKYMIQKESEWKSVVATDIGYKRLCEDFVRRLACSRISVG